MRELHRFNIATLALTTLFVSCSFSDSKKERPNVLIILADQWRYDAFGYRGNLDVKTPNIDKLASEGIVIENAISGIPVSTPARACLLTGQRPLTNGLFMNDVQLDTSKVTLAEAFSTVYETAYIGKWHLDGHGRSSFIPKNGRRQGFEYWKVLECTHDYNNSMYYADNPDTLKWNGYDCFAQTEDACNYIRSKVKSDSPFLLLLSWGPPHEPYQTAPEKYKLMYNSDSISLRPNVPKEHENKAREDIAGYYAHCSALDEMVGKLRNTLKETKSEDNTIILFLSDHGDMLGSHGKYKKQQPYEESIRIPMIYYLPSKYNKGHDSIDALINMEDVMPTLLGLCDMQIPESVEGLDYSEYLQGGENPGDTLTWISCIQPFGQWSRQKGGKEYRGIRSLRYTYVCDLKGPWLLFDNAKDPYQMNNLVNNPEYKDIRDNLDTILNKKLKENRDEFETGEFYRNKWNYPALDKWGNVPYKY